MGVWSGQWVGKDQDHHGQQEWNRGALQVQRDGRRPGEGALQRLPHRPPQRQDEAQGVQRDGREDDAEERRVQDGEARLQDLRLQQRRLHRLCRVHAHFHIMSDGTPEEVLEKIFRVFDVNSDGTINKKEMQRLIKDMYGLIKADDPEAESKDLMAKSAFAEMDKDADGKITCSEFTTACLSQEKISKMLALKVIDIYVEED